MTYAQDNLNLFKGMDTPQTRRVFSEAGLESRVETVMRKNSGAIKYGLFIEIVGALLQK